MFSRLLILLQGERFAANMSKKKLAAIGERRPGPTCEPQMGEGELVAIGASRGDRHLDPTRRDRDPGAELAQLQSDRATGGILNCVWRRPKTQRAASPREFPPPSWTLWINALLARRPFNVVVTAVCQQVGAEDLGDAKRRRTLSCSGLIDALVIRLHGCPSMLMPGADHGPRSASPSGTAASQRSSRRRPSPIYRI